MDLQVAFEQALTKSKQITKQPSTEQLLRLYALYKQATEGNVTGTRPSMFDFKGQAKYDAWAKENGSTQDEAKQKYADLVESLL